MVHPFFLQWAAILEGTLLCRSTLMSWAIGQAWRMWDVVSLDLHPPLHPVSSVGLLIISTVGRLELREICFLLFFYWVSQDLHINTYIFNKTFIVFLVEVYT